MSKIIMVPLTNIEIDEEFNCRDTISGVEVNNLAKSILEHKREVGHVHDDGSVQEEFYHGLIQPVTVRRIAGGEGAAWQLVAGYRRRAAFTRLAAEDSRYGTIPAIEVKCTELEAYRINLTENIQRKNLNLKEEAHAVGRLQKMGLTQMAIAQELGISRGWVQVRIYMFELPLDVQDEVVANNLSGTVVRELWQLPSADEQRAGIHSIKVRLSKGIKVVKVKERIRPKNKKLIPNKQEIETMAEFVADKVGWGLTTRAMAWCLGGIVDAEFEGTLESTREKRLAKHTMDYKLRELFMNQGLQTSDGTDIADLPQFDDFVAKAYEDEAARVAKVEEEKRVRDLMEEIKSGQTLEQDESDAA